MRKVSSKLSISSTAIVSPSYFTIVGNLLSGVAKPIINNKDEKTIKGGTRKKEKVGRNDPCPCGSGKKYKQCCGK